MGLRENWYRWTRNLSSESTQSNEMLAKPSIFRLMLFFVDHFRSFGLLVTLFRWTLALILYFQWKMVVVCISRWLIGFPCLCVRKATVDWNRYFLEDMTRNALILWILANNGGMMERSRLRARTGMRYARWTLSFRSWPEKAGLKWRLGRKGIWYR